MSPVRKQAFVRKPYSVTIVNANRISLARRERKMSKSAVVRKALVRAFRTFEPQSTVGAITLDGVETVTTTFNMTQGMADRIEASARGWRYSRGALFNALIDHAFTPKEAKDESAVSL